MYVKIEVNFVNKLSFNYIFLWEFSIFFKYMNCNIYFINIWIVDIIFNYFKWVFFVFKFFNCRWIVEIRYVRKIWFKMVEVLDYEK